MFNKLLRDESGITAIEYTLIASLISTLAIVSMQYIGTETIKTFNHIDAVIENSIENANRNEYTETYHEETYEENIAE